MVKRPYLGAMFVALYCLTVAPAWVGLHTAEKTIPPLIAAFYIFLTAVVITNLFTLKWLKQTSVQVKQSIKPLIGLNVTTTISWLTQFYALAYLTSGTVNSIIIGMLPLITYLISLPNRPTLSELFNTDTVFAIMILVCLFAISGFHFYNSPSLHETTQQLWIGIGLSVVCGITSTFNLTYSKQCAECGMSATNVLKTRFLLITLVTFILTWGSHTSLIIAHSTLLQLASLAVALLLVPLYLLQRGLEHIKAASAAFVIAMVPITTYLFQLFEPDEHFHPLEFSLIAILSGLLVAFAVIRDERLKKAPLSE